MLQIIIPLLFMMITKTSQHSNKDLEATFNSLYDLLQYNSSFDLLLQYGVQNESCAEKLFQTKQDLLIISNVLLFSGLSPIDIGKESECIATNMLYIFLTYNIKYDDNTFLNQYFKFLEEQQSFRGICVWKECYDYFIRFFNVTINPQLITTLANENITNLQIFNYDYQIGKKTRTEIYSKKYKMEQLYVLLLGLSIYVIFRIIMTIVALFTSNSKSNEDDISQMKISQINDASLNRNPVKSPENILDSSICSERTKRSSLNKLKIEKSLIHQVLLFSSLQKSLKILMKQQSKFYDESNMLQIVGFKFIIMFLISIGHNSWAIAKLPHKELSGLISYNHNNLWFALIKCGILSFESLKIINGIQFGFKFISYLEKFPNVKLTFVDMLKFYLKIIPQFIIFIVAIFCFHFFVMEYGLFISPNIGYEYFVTNTVSYIDFIKNPWRILIPFYYQYLFNNSNASNFTGCYRNLCFAMSEFYCFTFLCIILFLLIKLRKRMADYILVFLVILLIPVCSIKYPENIGQDFTLSKIYGSLNSFLYPHIFFILYFLGFNLGTILKYHQRTTQESISEGYELFRFNHVFASYYANKVKKSVSAAIFVISLGIMISIMFNYNILYAIFKTNGSILIQTNAVLKFFFIYEGQIFGIAFGGLAFVLMINKTDLAETFKLILENGLFIPIGRISTAFFLLDNFYVTVFYSIYPLSIYSNVKTTLFISLPLFLINLFMSFIIVILFELPFRIIYKKVTGSKIRKKKDLIETIKL